MPTERDADVLVVGAGPAGASAAGVAAAAGLRVSLVEARREVGLPVQCAEFVPAALREGAVDAARVQSVTTLGTTLPSGQAARIAAPGHMIQRARFDQALARAAVAAGAELRTGTRCVALDPRRGWARLRGREDETRTGFRVLIAADGAGSAVARLAGLPAQPVIHTRQYRVSLCAPLRETRVWLSAAFPGGYAWLFPKGGEANLGVGMDKAAGGDLRAALDSLHAQLHAEGRVGADILARTGGPIPVGGLREPLVTGRILFAGDAAGLAHPVTGAGIATAVESGRLAGEAAVRHLGGAAQALDDYAEEIEACFGASLRRACARRAEMRAAWRAGRFDDAAARRGWVVFPEYFAA